MGTIILRVLAGLLFLGAGIWLFNKQRKNSRTCTATVSATVTDYYTETSCSGADNIPTESYYPVMRYYVGDRWHEVRSSTGSGRRKYAVGDTVEILYDPEKPDNFILPGDKTNLIISLAFIAFGIFTLVSFFFD